MAVCCTNCSAAVLGTEVSSICTHCATATVAGASFSVPLLLGVAAAAAVSTIAARYLLRRSGGLFLTKRPSLA